MICLKLISSQVELMDFLDPSIVFTYLVRLYILLYCLSLFRNRFLNFVMTFWFVCIDVCSRPKP